MASEPLLELLPPADQANADQLLQAFLEYAMQHNLELYPAQEEAILELLSGKNVILNTPTGSGKSLVATALHFFALAQGKRSFYTCPIKALVSEKFFALCRDFGAAHVGLMTGDASVNRDAPIICCTAEILANMALREGSSAAVQCVIMDEFHYYADRERGVAWQIPLLTLPQTNFLLMSATLGDTAVFEDRLTQLTKRPTVTVRSLTRPVPLDYTYREDPLHETIAELAAQGKTPIYLVNFTQRACAEEAQKLLSTDFCTKEEKRAIASALYGVRFDSPYGKTLQRFVRHGIGLHHAGLLPKYRLLVEKLAQAGHLKIICGTDTLGVGINVPIRTVVFTQLCKYDGEKATLLSVRDFQQIAGRAGRRGFDAEGSVVAQAPEHVIENKRMTLRAASNPSKKKFVKRQPPERGYVAWDEATFSRLLSSTPETLTPSFRVSHGMLLNVLSRGARGCRDMVRLLRDAHLSPQEKRVQRQTAKSLFHSLVDAQIIEFDGRTPIVNTDLQDDFSLNQTLSLYLLDTIPRLEPEVEGFELDLLSLAEAIVENPDVILRRQLDKLKTQKMAEMKAAGVEYEERIAELEKLEYPKPNRDFIYATFNEFTSKHPWVGQENIRPKSIAREMVEDFYSFADYVIEYGLERAEGVLLRYLSEVYKVLVQTVPAAVKTDALQEMIAYLGAIVRRVDSSLLNEWERMRDPSRVTQAVSEYVAPEKQLAEPEREEVTRDTRAFTIMLRNELFRLVRALEQKRYETAADLLVEARAEEETSVKRWTAHQLDVVMRTFHQENGALRADAEARRHSYVRIQQYTHHWEIEQVLLAEEPTEWVLRVRVDLTRSNAAGRPVYELESIGTDNVADA